MSARRSRRPEISFRHVPEDGQVLALLYRISSGPVVQPCTAKITDYPPAPAAGAELNESFLSGRGVCQDLKKSPHWREEQGVVVLEREDYVPKHQSVARLQDEFWERFNDCTFTLKGTNQYCNQRTLKGGWLEAYSNTLLKDEEEQQRSILVVPKPELTPFRKICPETAALVDIVQQRLYQLVPNYKGRLVATEYTYLLGYSQTSCTLWHQDTAEHAREGLVLTSVTLLSDGKSSMCIASSRHSVFLLVNKGRLTNKTENFV